MDKKEAAYLLQRIDCNCNDCGFMKRNFDELNLHRARHRDNQYVAFSDSRAHKTQQAAEWLYKGEKEKCSTLLREAADMKFQYQSPVAEIQYGHCQKFDKPVTFIPNICQIDTQHCFVHRKDYVHDTPGDILDKTE